MHLFPYEFVFFTHVVELEYIISVCPVVVSIGRSKMKFRLGFSFHLVYAIEPHGDFCCRACVNSQGVLQSHELHILISRCGDHLLVKGRRRWCHSLESFCGGVLSFLLVRPRVFFVVVVIAIAIPILGFSGIGRHRRWCSNSMREKIKILGCLLRELLYRKLVSNDVISIKYRGECSCLFTKMFLWIIIL